MNKLRIAILVSLVLWLVSRSDRFLVVDHPQKADVIVVLAGETDKRPARGLELLQQGLANKVVLDVPGDARVYDTTYVDVARRWADAFPQSSAITICPIHGLSTKAEAIESAACAKSAGANSILLVTSDYHTRRARSVFRTEIKSMPVDVAAVYDPTQFGDGWWRHRQWAKTNLDEWLRLIWWEIVDRWRS
jgi:uncharacterized SAM-binding protein YcdF (DUF218 family)